MPKLTSDSVAIHTNVDNALKLTPSHSAPLVHSVLQCNLIPHSAIECHPISLLNLGAKW